MNKNVNCCGSHCRSEDGEVRVYPLGSGGNLILCKACWAHENAYRAERNREYQVGYCGHSDPWPQTNWSTAEIYGEGK